MGYIKKYCIFLFLGWLFTSHLIYADSLDFDKSKVMAEMYHALTTELLDIWYPLSMDTLYGGFLSNFSYDWKMYGPQNKMIVTQTRHVWTASKAALFFKDDKYRKIAEHGFQFLKMHMWDSEYGGFFTLCNQKGEPILEPTGFNAKIGYGHAFAIYALSVYYQASHDTSALNLAKKTFQWLEKHHHDSKYKGYFNVVNRDGSLMQPHPGRGFFFPRKPDWKGQNTSIHLLEAFCELYKVWPVPIVHKRLLEMLQILRDTMIGEKNYLTLFSKRDWTPISFQDSSEVVRKQNYYLDHISFGHDIEAAYLLLETTHALDESFDDKTIKTAVNLVDFTLNNGWDASVGGIYDQGYRLTNADTTTIIHDAKIWWVQAEALNSLLLMSHLFPDNPKYTQRFIKQWEYITKYLIDHENGGWFTEGLDRSPGAKNAPKASEWKINYHNARALINCIQILKDECKLMNSHD